MKILITMAGDGKRFADAGITTIKPLIEIENKTILEWTTESLPFIKHRGLSKINKEYEIAFAIRAEHDVGGILTSRLKNIYGTETKIQTFEKLTRGNLETAYISAYNLFGETDDELLVLDADNHYNGKNFLFKKNIYATSPEDFGMICCFAPKDNSEKWCFAKTGHDDKVISLHEKEKVKNSAPMVGVFYFSKTSLFLNLAKEILDSNETVKKEFYMSQAIQKMLDKKMNVYGITVSDVCPLGTPEDVAEYSKFLVTEAEEQKEFNEAKDDKFTRH